MRFIARHFHNGDMICTMHLCLSYWGSHFILLQREHEMGRGWKWEKEILQNWMRHRGFWPCGIEKYSIFLPFIVGGRGYHFLLPQREEGRGNRWIWGKREEVAEDWDLTTASNMMCPFASAGCACAPPSSWISTHLIEPFAPPPRTDGKTNSKTTGNPFFLSVTAALALRDEKKGPTLAFPFHFPWPP